MTPTADGPVPQIHAYVRDYRPTLSSSHHVRACSLCASEGPTTRHHLVPSAMGGSNADRTDLCQICHRFLHWRFPNEVLAGSLNTLETLLAHPDVRAYLDYRRESDPELAAARHAAEQLAARYSVLAARRQSEADKGKSAQPGALVPPRRTARPRPRPAPVAPRQPIVPDAPVRPATDEERRESLRWRSPGVDPRRDREIREAALRAFLDAHSPPK